MNMEASATYNYAIAPRANFNSPNARAHMQHLPAKFTRARIYMRQSTSPILSAAFLLWQLEEEGR